MTSSNIQLESLDLLELNILLGHLRLGEGHLKKQLSRAQFKHLLELGQLNIEQQINVSSNRAEKSGNIALVLNTVITSVFGAWMGFSGFMGLQLNSYLMLSGITIIALFTSVLVGYFSFKLTLKNAQAAIYRQKIHNIQLTILKLITSKQQETLSSVVKYLNHALHYVTTKSLPFKEKKADNKLFDFDQIEDFHQWKDQVTKAILVKSEIIKEEAIYIFYSERLLKIIDRFDQIINASFLLELPTTSLQSHLKGDQSLLQILSRSPDYVTYQSPHRTWFRQNFLALIAGIVPTLLGGFASMFVFLAGGPNLAKELALHHVEAALRKPGARFIELSIAVALTIYYGASFVYNNYKTYIRQHEVEKIKKHLIRLEKQDVYLKRKRTILSKLKRETKRIINIYTAIENIDVFTSKLVKDDKITTALS